MQLKIFLLASYLLLTQRGLHMSQYLRHNLCQLKLAENLWEHLIRIILLLVINCFPAIKIQTLKSKLN